jgi:heme A synthase
MIIVFVTNIIAGQSGTHRHPHRRVPHLLAESGQITAFVVAILSLAEAALAVATLRGRRPAVAGWAVGLFVLLVIQTALGEIMSSGNGVLVTAHVPVALLIMGVGAYLSVAGFRLRLPSGP